MRGFIVGSFGLIVLYAVVTRSEGTAAALTGTQRLVSRLLSSKVAGVADRASGIAQDDPAPSAAGAGVAPSAFTSSAPFSAIAPYPSTPRNA